MLNPFWEGLPYLPQIISVWKCLSNWKIYHQNVFAKPCFILNLQGSFTGIWVNWRRTCCTIVFFYRCDVSSGALKKKKSCQIIHKHYPQTDKSVSLRNICGFTVYILCIDHLIWNFKMMKFTAAAFVFLTCMTLLFTTEGKQSHFVNVIDNIHCLW